MIRINNIKLPLDYTDKSLLNKVSKLLTTPNNNIKNIYIVKKAIDSRRKGNIHFVVNINVGLDSNEDKILRKCAKNNNISKADLYTYTINKTRSTIKNPIVVGFGSAGMFAGLVLAMKGLEPIIIERGKTIENRQKDIELLQNNGILNINSNVQFGEGGAGAFSDGKLTTGIKDKRIDFVLKNLVDFGAPNEILYNAKPHIGTDNLKNVVKNCREKIKLLGGKFLFETTLENILTTDGRVTAIGVKTSSDKFEIIPTDTLILAIGHSARDTFNMLYSKNIAMEQKPFSVGVRIEHLRTMIDKAQYGNFAGNPKLGTATYKMSCNSSNGRGVYTFCMCPGGHVVCASSEKNTVVTNGMSYFARDAVNSNSALLVSINNKDFNSDLPLAGIEFQRRLEKKAFVLGGGNYKAPIQRVGDFLGNKKTSSLGAVLPSYKPSTEFANLSELFPDFICSSLREAIIKMGQRLRGFDFPDALLTGVESRSSSPVRILRDKNTYNSVSIKGLYPIGEGAGYAGGIVSAAVDAIRCTENL